MEIVFVVTPSHMFRFTSSTLKLLCCKVEVTDVWRPCSDSPHVVAAYYLTMLQFRGGCATDLLVFDVS